MRSVWLDLGVSVSVSLGLALRVGVVVTLAAATAAVGCGGGRAPFDGTTYRDGAIAFRVPPAPAGWRPIAVTDATLAYRDDADDASVLVNARCGDRQADAPLEALRNHLLAGTTARELSFEETIPFDGREALHTHAVAKLDGVPMGYDIFVLKKDGCVYDFVRVFAPAPAPGSVSSGDAGTPLTLAPGGAAFEGYVKSFHTLPRGRGGAS